MQDAFILCGFIKLQRSFHGCLFRKHVEADMLDRREASATEEAQSNITEVVALGNAEPEVGPIQPAEVSASEDVSSTEIHAQLHMFT